MDFQTERDSASQYCGAVVGSLARTPPAGEANNDSQLDFALQISEVWQQRFDQEQSQADEMKLEPTLPRKYQKSRRESVSWLLIRWNVAILITLSAGAAWSADFAWRPGLEGTIPYSPSIHSVMDFGAAGDGVTDDSAAFQAALDSLPENGGAVFVPPGTYLLRSTIQLGDGAVLRGSGAASSRLRFDLDGRDDTAIEVVTYDRGAWVDAVSGYEEGSAEINVTDASSFIVPTFAEIQQTNDPEVMFTDPLWDQVWAENAVGEIVRVDAKIGNRLILHDPLRFTYDPAMNPRIRSQGFIEDVGIEHLHISRVDDGGGNTILLKNAAWAWVREVEIDTTSRTHVHVDTVYGCEIRGSYIHHAHDYGGGGNAYGVELINHTTGCLVENNIFTNLRHSMMVHVGANGNVFGYNYSREATSEGAWLPNDISLHGHFPFDNLFESNVLQAIGVGDYWGPAGPANTMLRNCVQDEGIVIEDHSHGQFVIGNTLTAGAQNQILIDPSVLNSIVHGNYVNGDVQWDPGIPDHTIAESYYLSSRPPFYGDALPWPSIGGDLGPACSNPAMARWESGEATPGVSPIFVDDFESGTAGAWVVFGP
jgi:hypothetical protein